MMTSTSPTHAADRLLNAIDAKAAPVCVGLDPVVERLPGVFRSERPSPAVAAAGIDAFCREALEQLEPYAPCVKIQAACFERYGSHGYDVMLNLIGCARYLGLEVILDAKRGDIGISAEHYAAAAFADNLDGTSREHRAADWLTVNGYLGADAIEPFLVPGRGAFVLVRTSNPGSDALQSKRLEDGRTVAEAVASIVAETGSRCVGQRGYSALGAVVGATKREDAARLRQIMPQQMFLVPGFGAQGGGVEDVLPCFCEGRAGRREGAIVTASRSVIYAFDPDDPAWSDSIGEAADRFADEIGRATGYR